MSRRRSKTNLFTLQTSTAIIQPNLAFFLQWLQTILHTLQWMTVVIAEKKFNDKRNAAFSCNMTVNICCIRIVESNGRNIYNLAYILQTACRPKKVQAKL